MFWPNFELSSTDSNFYMIECNRKTLQKQISKFMSQTSAVAVIMIDGESCQSHDEMLNEFAEKFNFPSYFGFNLDALDECLNDLEWIGVERYLLIINHFNKFLKDEPMVFQQFTLILKDTIQEWNIGRCYGAQYDPPTQFDVIFHCENSLQSNANRLKYSGISELTIIKSLFKTRGSSP